MGIDFSKTRWDVIKENYTRWWAGETQRPMLSISCGGNEPGRTQPTLPNHHFHSFHDLSISAEAIIDTVDYGISTQKFVGDAFPSFWPNFGPGVIAAFMGAELHTSQESHTTWFHPTEDLPAEKLRFDNRYDPDNIWLKRIKDIYQAGVERWQGMVQMGMTDLGGNLDIASSFLPSEKMLLELYDNPREVKRLGWEGHSAWWRYFQELNSVAQQANPGYTAWTAIFSTEPYYILQCDFCYMIGPDMFDEFVKPELAASCQRLKNAFYHLDGPGELPHLDSLLTIPELAGVQWIPGAGQPGIEAWGEVYRKIRDAGKKIQIWGGGADIEALYKHLGSLEGVVFLGWADNEAEAKAIVEKWGK